MVNRIFILSLNAIREMYRDRFYLILFVSAGALILISLLLGELTFEEQNRLLFDVGLTAIYLLNLSLMIFLGGQSLKREIEKNTYMTILSAETSRSEFLLSKIFGFLSVSIFSTFFLGFSVFFLLKGTGGKWTTMCQILTGVLLESAILLVASLLFNLLFSPFIAIFSAVSLFLIGNGLDSLVFFAQKSKDLSLIYGADLISKTLPNLYRLNWRSFEILERGITSGPWVWTLVHGFSWLFLLTALTLIQFRRRQLF